MKEAIRKNKKIIIISIVIIFILLIGLAFAYLVTTLHGEKEYLVRAGTLDLVLNEGNELTLEKVIPIEDSEGMTLNGFTFSLVNNGSVDTDYRIYLDDVELTSGETRMPDSAIRYSLTRNEEVIGPKNLTTMGSNPNRRVDFGTISPDETINYTLRIWIDYDATTEEASGKTFKGKLRVEASQSVGESVADILLADSSNNINTTDPEQTFITGENPNNYIWYSGKLWRAVSVDPADNSVKLVTQWNISSIPYNNDSSAFEGSYMEDWLNDTTVDGFLYNLRDYERFIKLDSKWNATMMSDASKPPSTTIVESPVGLLNLYEYGMSYSNIDSVNGYLRNKLDWWTITPYSSNNLYYLGSGSNISRNAVVSNGGIRPSINLRNDVKIISGSGTEEDPYRLLGDKDEKNNGTYLNTRYSGEYIRFGTGENNLYQIISHETRGLTKITSAEPLRENGAFKTISFGDSINYSSNNTIGSFLNNDYLNIYNGYLTTDNLNMISDNTTWYLGSITGKYNYKLTKYSDITNNILIDNVSISKIGLIRLGELMSGQMNSFDNSAQYWTLTSSTSSAMYCINVYCNSGYYSISGSNAIKPALNLKSNVIITSGDGTKNNPFEIELQ